MLNKQQLLETFGRIEFQSKHRFILAYSLAMHFNVELEKDVIKAKIASNDITIIETQDRSNMDDVLATLLEFVPMSQEDLASIRDTAKDVYRWRLCFVCGIDPRTLPTHGENCGDMGLFALYNNFIKPEDQAGACAIKSTDKPFIDGIHSIIDFIYYKGVDNGEQQ